MAKGPISASTSTSRALWSQVQHPPLSPLLASCRLVFLCLRPHRTATMIPWLLLAPRALLVLVGRDLGFPFLSSCTLSLSSLFASECS
ncbi:hypothetical protein BCR44DRAFT_1447691 [Catenaria anguillulae PL171]|uniref:Uncharacterized protein n=1 Tax=Catenaria anguillulae PL171 TaxID=765915 RepID=A0A1Y2H5G2_9FUNG|nr:hypothetical protein BCR44DRAFT_1447691 [Catenaria anguillulae PL171]